MSVLDDLGDVEIKQPQAIKVRTTTVKQHKGKGKTTVVKMAVVGSLKVSRRQIWTDLLAAGLAHEKLDGQPLEV